MADASLRCLPQPDEPPEADENSGALTPEDVAGGDGTRELLERQNRINAAQEPPPGLESTPQTPSIWLQDAEGDFRALETENAPLLSSSSSPPAPEKQLLFPQSDAPTGGLNQIQPDGGGRQRLLSSGTRINGGDFGSLIPGTPSEDDDSLAELLLRPDGATAARLSREVELLAGRNEALNQRNQEMLNQLTEADREIERLKAELGGRYAEPRHLPEVEQLARTRVEDLEGELSSRDRQLTEAQSTIASLEESLREAEAENKGYLLRCFEATEAKLTELEGKLGQSERARREAEADLGRLREELEEERRRDGERDDSSGEEKIRQVIDGMVLRLRALEKILEAMDTFDFGKEEEEEETPTVESQLRWEEEFWGFLKLKVDRSELGEEKPEDELLVEVTEHMTAEVQLLLLGHRLFSESSADGGLEEPDLIRRIASEAETDEDGGMLDSERRPYEMEYFISATRVKLSLLKHLASSVGGLHPAWADRLPDRRPRSGFVHSAATEALLCRRLSRLQGKYQRRLEETKQEAPLASSSVVCSSCVALTEENRELRARLTTLEAEQRAAAGDKTSRCSQTGEDQPEVTGVKLEVADEIEEEEEEEVESLETPPGGESGLQETADGNTEESDASREEAEPSGEEAEQVSALRRRVEELEEMKGELDGNMSSVQRQHEAEMEKLKVSPPSQDVIFHKYMCVYI